MKSGRLYFTALLLLISGIVLLVHTYSNVLPEIMENTPADVTTPVLDTAAGVDTLADPPTATDTFLCSVYFSPGATLLSAKERLRLTSLLRSLSGDDTYTFRIDGYADPTGAGAVNNDLIALNRSFSVYAFLQSKGITKDKILMRSFGSPYGGEASNDSLRKVDITLIGGALQ